MNKADAQAAIDAQTVASIAAVAGKMNLPELIRFCEGMLRASAVAQRVLIERFGMAEWEKFNAAVESGRFRV